MSFGMILQIEYRIGIELSIRAPKSGKVRARLKKRHFVFDFRIFVKNISIAEFKIFLELKLVSDREFSIFHIFRFFVNKTNNTERFRCAAAPRPRFLTNEQAHARCRASLTLPWSTCRQQGGKQSACFSISGLRLGQRLHGGWVPVHPHVPYCS